MSPIGWTGEVRASYVASMGAELATHQLELEGYVAELHRYWTLFVGLLGTSQARVEALHRTSPGVLALLTDLLWDDLILRISRLTDPPKPGTKFANLSLRALLPLVSVALRPELERRLAAVDIAAAAARTHRDKVIAHADFQYALAPNGERLPPITRGDLRRAIEGLTGIVQVVHAHYFVGDALAFQAVDVETAVFELFDVVRLGVLARDAREERLRRGEDLPEDSEAPL